MTLTPLRDDALTATDAGSALQLSLPWIRSLPLASLTDPTVRIAGKPVAVTGVRIHQRLIPIEEIGEHDGAWWFQQDRIALELDVRLEHGRHEVEVEFGLRIPYIQGGPDGPLTLRFRDVRSLDTDAPRSGRHSALMVERADATNAVHAEDMSLPDGWVLSASSFNWTPDMITTDDSAPDLVVAIVERGIATEVEAEPGQLWRTFPGDTTAQAEALRARLDAAGGAVSIMGASIDDWSPRGTRRTDDERLAFLLPQLDAAHRLGARGVRVPIGAAGPGLLTRVLPLLHERDLTWFEEIQGPQTPGSPQAGAAIDHIVSLDDPRVRLLVDISMFMPAVPESYLRALEAGGVPPTLITRLREEWTDPATGAEVMDVLRSGAVPGSVLTLYMDMLIRFGRSDSSAIADVLPWVGAFHLKFWDLVDDDRRVSAPIAAVGELLSGTDFRGTLCSEWGGQEWLDDDPATMTRAHLEVARTALTAGLRRAASSL